MVALVQAIAQNMASLLPGLGLAIRSRPHPSPLPEGEGADRVVLRGTSTWKILVIMVLVKGLGDYGFGGSEGCE